MRDVVGYIQRFQDRFSKTEKKIAQYVILHPEETLSSSVDDLARATGTSGATVVRFCRTIGFRGFMDFKYQMERSVLYVVENEQQLMQEDNIATIKNKVIGYEISLLEEFRSSLDDMALDRTCDALIKADRVLIFAEGGSASMADYAKISFIHIGIYCQVEVDATLQMMAAEYVTEKDVVIGMTHSGRITNTIDALSAAQRRGATTVAITGKDGSLVCQYADIVLACNINHPFDLSDFQGSRLEEFCVISILQMAMLMRTYESTTQLAKRISAAAELKRLGAAEEDLHGRTAPVP